MSDVTESTEIAEHETAHDEVPSGGGWLKLSGRGSLLPLGVLFGLNLVDEFDRVAFASLISEIRDAFGLSDAGIAAVGIVSSVFVLLAALPIGVVADRYNRIRLAFGAAVLWGTMSVLTGLVPTVLLLFFVRLFSGLGRIINEVVHPSLLTDYYRSSDHPQVFKIHRMANPIGNGSAVIAGVVGETWGWEWAFFILAIPTIFFLLLLLRLREPRRGESVDADMAAQVEQEAAIPFAEAKRQLWAVRTLKRLWIGAFFLGIGWIPIGEFLSLFFEKVYGFGPIGRGNIQFLRGAGIVLGLFIGGYLAKKAVEEDRRERLATITGLSFVWFAGGLILMALAPWAPLSAAFAFVLSMGIGAYQPAYFSLVGQVAPPLVRSQAYAWAVLFVGAGGLASIPLFSVGENSGYRLAVGILSVIVAIAGMIGASASRSVRRDIQQAESTLGTALRIRKEFERDGGKPPILICKGVDVAYDSVQILFGVDLEVQENEIVALLGTNGAGKSTLLKAIAGLVDPVGGAIFFDGRDITHADAVQAAKSGIVVVPGGKAVFPTLTVAEHFKAGTWLYAEDDPADIQARIDDVLDRFPRLRERWDQLAGNLSGGEQQQLALGMAFVAKPRLLIIDELSLGLAPTIVELLLNMVRTIHAEGCTIILVEQSVNVALTVADRAYFLEKGEVRFSGPTGELLERGDILRSVFLEGAGSIETKGGPPSPGVPATDVLTKETAALARKASQQDGPVLEVRDLQRRFGGITAVDHVSFHLDPGEILGLIGPNGAGKTTIFDLVSGLLPLDGGRIFLRGIEVTRMGADRRAALGLGRSFQDARIFPSLTVAENIALGLERHIEVRDHLAALLGLPAIQESEEDVAYTVDDLIDLMNLGAFRDKFVSELSTGSRRIVDLAMAIAHDPAVLILDEPSSGIAQRETEALGPLLKRIQREAGCAMLVIEHDMPLITSVSDRMLALELGAIVCEGTPQEVISNPRVVEAYLGGDLDVINRSGDAQGGSGRPAPAVPAPRRTGPVRASRPPAGNGQDTDGIEAGAGEIGGERREEATAEHPALNGGTRRRAPLRARRDS